MIPRKGAVAVLALVCAGPAPAEEAPAPHTPAAREAATITVEGEASEAFLPDKAILSFGVVTEQPRAVDAANRNSTAVRSVIDAVKQEGIEARAIQSTSVSLEPVFQQTPGGGESIVGFRASNRLDVEVAPPDRAGLLAGKLIERGVNTIDAIRFASNANAERADRLRGQAMRDARHKAQTYVAALGLKLGRVLVIAPSGGASVATDRYKTVSRAAKVAVPVEAGEQTDSASVAVTWEVLD